MLGGNANSVLHGESAGTAQQHRTVKADYQGYVSELLSKAVDQGALDAELTTEDKEALLTFLSYFGDIGEKSAGFAYTGGGRRGYEVEPGAADQEGVPLGPPPSLSQVLSSRLGRYLSFEAEYNHAMTLLQPVGGMDVLTDALHEAVKRSGATVITGAPVSELRNTADGVEVAYRGPGGESTTVSGDFCVATVPPNLLARIPTNLGSRVTSALRFPQVYSAGKMGLEYDRRWWESDERIYGGITMTDLDLLNIWYPSHGFHSDRGVLVGYYNEGPMAEVYSPLTPAERERRALAQGVKIHGEKYRRGMRASFSVAWDRTPYVEGGWVNWPSRDSGEYDLLNEPAGNVYFAGDWLSHFIAWQAGAIDSARYAVTALHERVGSS